ncbi:MAG: membrane protein insertion efficiency factor YidD [Acidobacteriota bacterium]
MTDRARTAGPERRPRRRLALAAAFLALVLLRIDLGRAPERQLAARFLLGAIDAYQATLSPALGRAGAACRFRPSCSHYGEGVIRRHGAVAGTLEAAWRIARCGPWTEPGTVDPP